MLIKTLAKWSVNDYHRMIEAGILQDRRVELLAGEIVEMSPETPIHYNLAKRGTKFLEKLFDGKADVRFNGPITLLDSEPEPDIAIVKLPESRYEQRHPDPEDIFCVIEVANTSLEKDSTLKKELYATSGIQEYWILDVQAKQLIVFRQSQGKNYLSERKLRQGNITLLAFPKIEVSVEKLFY